MKRSSDPNGGNTPERVICCALCRHFRYFENRAGHNSRHALGKCTRESWEGNQGQWPMFQHPCKNFDKAEAKRENEEAS